MAETRVLTLADVSFVEANFSYWSGEAGDRERAWFRRVWQAIIKAGLASYRTELERCQVAIRCMALRCIYADFLHLAIEDQCAPCLQDDAEALGIKAFQLGVVYGHRRHDQAGKRGRVPTESQGCGPYCSGPVAARYYPPLATRPPLLTTSTRPTFVLVGQRARNFVTLRVFQAGAVVLEAPASSRHVQWPLATPPLAVATECEVHVIPAAGDAPPVSVIFTVTDTGDSATGQAITLLHIE